MASNRQQLIGRFINRTKGSERKGEKFKVVMRNGKRYHDYGGGRLIADKSGPPKAAPPAGVTPSRNPRKSISDAAASAGRAGRRVSTPAPGPVRGGLGTPSWGKPGVAPPAPTGSPTAGSAASAAQLLRKNATGTGARLNIAQDNPRRGQRFNVIQRGDKTLHKYAPGRVFTGQAAGPGSVRYRKPKRKPPLPSGARTGGFGSTSWSQR